MSIQCGTISAVQCHAMQYNAMYRTKGENASTSFKYRDPDQGGVLWRFTIHHHCVHIVDSTLLSI